MKLGFGSGSVQVFWFGHAKDAIRLRNLDGLKKYAENIYESIGRGPMAEGAHSVRKADICKMTH